MGQTPRKPAAGKDFSFPVLLRTVNRWVHKTILFFSDLALAAMVLIVILAGTLPSFTASLPGPRGSRGWWGLRSSPVLWVGGPKHTVWIILQTARKRDGSSREWICSPIFASWPA
jgi:hypothetical protein